MLSARTHATHYYSNYTNHIRPQAPIKRSCTHADADADAARRGRLSPLHPPFPLLRMLNRRPPHQYDTSTTPARPSSLKRTRNPHWLPSQAVPSSPLRDSATRPRRRTRAPRLAVHRARLVHLEVLVHHGAQQDLRGGSGGRQGGEWSKDAGNKRGFSWHISYPSPTRSSSAHNWRLAKIYLSMIRLRQQLTYALQIRQLTHTHTYIHPHMPPTLTA